MGSDPASVVAPSPASDIKPCLGVLFVHGAGDHSVGSTLIEFGEPMVTWLDGWLSKGKQAPTSTGDAARAGAAQLLVREADSHAPAHAAVMLRTGLDRQPHAWLLAEARWDEAFTPPAFKQVLQWAVGVVPWTVLTQFIGPVIDESRELRPDVLSILRFFWNIVASTFLALVAAVVLQAVALVILLLSIIPLDPVRDLVSKLQRFASSSVGDLYMVLTSPIQRAALTSAVQRDIDWLRAQGCDRIAVVAHSQGGYVAYQALTDPWYRPVEMFITFGSGLVRLTESEMARRKGLLISALIGVIGALIAIRFAPIAIPEAFGKWQNQASILAFGIGLVMSVGLVLAIRRYRQTRLRIPDLPMRTPWADFLTTHDPVFNGSRLKRLPMRTLKIRVQNRASVVADHGSYWQNLDQFVSRVATKIGTLDPDLGLLRAGPKDAERPASHHLRRSWKRRNERVAALERMRGPLAIATAVLLGLRLDQLEPVGRQVAGLFSWVPSGLISWLPDFFVSIVSIVPIAVSHLALLGAAVIVGLSFLGYRIGVGLWEAWSRADLAAQWAGGAPDHLSSRAIAFYAWTVIHVVAIAFAALVGPATIGQGIGDSWAQRNSIADAWTRLGIGTLIVAAVVVGGAIIRTRNLPSPWFVGFLVRGTTLALLVELAIATAWRTTILMDAPIATGVVVGGTALLLAEGMRPIVRAAFEAFARRAQRFIKPPPMNGPVASPLDRIGVGGLLAMAIAIVLVLQKPDIAIIGAGFAIVGFLLTALMATNKSGRTLPFIGKSAATPGDLRLGGWVGTVASLIALVVGVVRGVPIVFKLP